MDRKLYKRKINEEEEKIGKDDDHQKPKQYLEQV